MKDKIKVNIDNVYEGPMDLLLSLIKDNKIDIYDIPISYLTDEFISRIGQMSYSNLDSFLDFSLMASILLQIKSKMLLPKFVEDEEEEDPRKDLVDRIIEYRHFKNISTIFREYNKVANRKLSKKSEDLTILALEEKIDYKEVTSSRLASVYSRLLFKKNIEEKEMFFDIEEDKYTIEACLDILSKKIQDYNKLYFKNLFDDESSKLEIVTYFLALLELMKLKKIKVNQKDEDIKIERISNDWFKKSNWSYFVCSRRSS